MAGEIGAGRGTIRRMGRCRIGIVAAGALAAALLAVAPLGQARQAVTLTLNVNFSYTGQITLSLPDGTPVGTTSGSPTVIPAGYYSVILRGPGACTLTPYFMLKGPNVTITDNMSQGEEDFYEYVANFQPNSTYTWRNSENPSVVYTFVTNGSVVGTQPPPVTWTGPLSTKSSNKDIVGSGLIPVRGTLTGTVGTGGQLDLAFNGKGVTNLKPGRYKLAITDKSATSGLMIENAKKKPVNITGARFIGKHTASVNLSAGTWLFMTGVGTKALTVFVR
jgi:hypothetical protein